MSTLAAVFEGMTPAGICTWLAFLSGAVWIVHRRTQVHAAAIKQMLAEREILVKHADEKYDDLKADVKEVRDMVWDIHQANGHGPARKK